MDRLLAALVGAYGSTDAKGPKFESGPVTVPDLFATIATLLGIDPKREEMSPDAGRSPFPTAERQITALIAS
jgi:hypothetical protein